MVSPPPDRDPTLALARERNSSAHAQRALEQRFDASFCADDLREWMRRIAARPHHVGSPYGKENAEFIASLFRSWGYDTRIEEFGVLFPTPRTRLLEMLEPTRFQATLCEPPLTEDSTSGQTSETSSAPAGDSAPPLVSPVALMLPAARALSASRTKRVLLGPPAPPSVNPRRDSRRSRVGLSIPGAQTKPQVRWQHVAEDRLGAQRWRRTSVGVFVPETWLARDVDPPARH